MKGKIKHITIALGICLLLAMIVLGLKNRNTIYTWFLGDVQTLYMQADSLYRQKRYEDAETLYSKLAKIDTAKRCQFILGDIYYQGKTGVRNYKKAMKLFLESADNGNADSQNNLGYMYAYGIEQTSTILKPENISVRLLCKDTPKHKWDWAVFTGMAGELPRAIRKHSSYIKRLRHMIILML